MADQTLQFTSYTTPDQTADPVSVPSNTGHLDSDVIQGVIFGGTLSPSCKWTGLQSYSALPRTLTLKADYSWQFDGGSVNSVFYIQYSTDAGSNWTDAVRLTNANDTTGSISVSLPFVAANQIQVRDLGQHTAEGAHNMAVSNLRVEIDYGQAGIVGMM
jgi:hypothetical protein